MIEPEATTPLPATPVTMPLADMTTLLSVTGETSELSVSSEGVTAEMPLNWDSEMRPELGIEGCTL